MSDDDVRDRAERLREQHEAGLLVARIAELEADLAERGRMLCGTCRWREPGAMEPDSCGVLQGFIPSNDFGCNQYRARAEGMRP